MATLFLTESLKSDALSDDQRRRTRGQNVTFDLKASVKSCRLLFALHIIIAQN